MTDFIIYEENWELHNNYKMIILNFLGCREDKFKIYDYETYQNNICNNKIYILGSDNSKKALTIAKKIRSQGDWDSQIIVMTSKENNDKHNKLLILDYIMKDEKLKENLKSALIAANKILSNCKRLSFVSDGEIYKLPYKDILYIEKVNNQNYCIIYTKTDSYNINATISYLEEELNDICFMKTHRSCIVNLNNIKTYNYCENIIYFKNAKIDLISRNKRQVLKERILNNKIV